MKIGIDLDNTLNNLNTRWIQKYNLLNKDNLTIEDIKCWDIHKYVKNGKEIYSYLNPSLFYTLNPIPYSIEVTKELSNQHELFIITATSHTHMETKVNWLEEYFPHIDKDNIISTYRKDLINVDLLIDDAVHNIINFPNSTIIFDQPWNRNLVKGYNRASSWLEVSDIIQTMS